MDLLVFAAGVFLYARAHRVLGCVLIFFGALYILMGLLSATLPLWVNWFVGVLEHA